MHPEFGDHLEVLPVIPEDVLKKHHCHLPLDTRYRATARLLSSLWRSARGLPIGSYVDEGGTRTKLGSRLSNAAGRAGFNFLSPEIAGAVHRELRYRELGAMIDEERLWTNCLSSMPMTLNLLMPLKFELAHATSALHELIPGFVGTVTDIRFEHSPGRGNPRFLGDYSAFDALFRYTTPEGRHGFVAVETKYSEAYEPIPKSLERYDEFSERSGLYRDPADQTLRSSSLNQLWREHMLGQRMIDEGLYDEGTFVLIGPSLNHHVQHAALAYAGLLEPAETHKVRFLNLTLEDVVEVIRLCDPEHAAALHRRYLDYRLVGAELKSNAPKFTSFIRTPRRSNRLQIRNAEAGNIDPSSSYDGPTADTAPRLKRPRRVRSQETA